MACGEPCLNPDETFVAGCDSPLPEVAFDICNPKFHFGQISDIFLTNLSHPLSDVTNQLEWANRLFSNGDPTASSKIIRIMGIGDKPAAEYTETPASYGRFAYGIKTHTINFKIDEVSEKNYDMMRHFECNRVCLMWYKTFNGMVYGGDSGIKVSIQFNHIIPESAGDLETISGTLKWMSKHHPCRNLWPLQALDEQFPGQIEI